MLSEAGRIRPHSTQILLESLSKASTPSSGRDSKKRVLYPRRGFHAPMEKAVVQRRTRSA
jgi:hypothetical protein